MSVNSPKFILFLVVTALVAICMLIYGQSVLNLFSSSIPTPTSIPTIPPIFTATISQPSFCYNGPAEYYQGPVIAAASTVVSVLATTNDTMDWFMVQEQSIGRCWINKQNLLNINIDDSKILRFITALTTSESLCYMGPSLAYTVQTRIPPGWRIVIYGKDGLGADWALITPHDSTEQCWVASNLLTDFDSSKLSIVPVPTLIPSPTITLTNIVPTDPSRIRAEWRILSYECNSAGRAIGVQIGLNVSGGTPPYEFSPQVPLSAQPGQVVTINVKSNTSNGEPSTLIEFRVPSASDNSVFKCDRPGNNPGPTSLPPTSVPPTPIPSTPIPPTPIPPTPVKSTPTLCWPGPCK